MLPAEIMAQALQAAIGTGWWHMGFAYLRDLVEPDRDDPVPVPDPRAAEVWELARAWPAPYPEDALSPARPLLLERRGEPAGRRARWRQGATAAIVYWDEYASREQVLGALARLWDEHHPATPPIGRWNGHPVNPEQRVLRYWLWWRWQIAQPPDRRDPTRFIHLVRAGKVAARDAWPPKLGGFRDALRHARHWLGPEERVPVNLGAG